MAQEGLAIRRPIAALLTAAVLAAGILFGVGVTVWAGHPAFGAQRMSPAVSGVKGRPEWEARRSLTRTFRLEDAL
jgi:hypothetical protein